MAYFLILKLFQKSFGIERDGGGGRNLQSSLLGTYLGIPRVQTNESSQVKRVQEYLQRKFLQIK